MKDKEKLTAAHGLIDRIYKDVFPKYGFSVRQGQIAMSHQMLDSLVQQNIAAIHAEVGTGKTYAYLIALIVYRKYFPNERQAVADPKVPIISTTSIQLQKALMQEYIPMLSKILMQDGILSKPLKALLRTGKKHYVCDARLSVRLEQIKGSNKSAESRQALEKLKTQLELDAVPELSSYDRERVCVPSQCMKNCPKRRECRYRTMIAEAKEQRYDFQICNHNLLLADAMHRYEGRGSILHNSDIVIVDEAHDLPEIARDIYTHYFSEGDCLRFAEIASRWNYPAISTKVNGLSQYIWKKIRKAENGKFPDCVYSSVAQLADLGKEFVLPPIFEAEKDELFLEGFVQMLTDMVKGSYAVAVQKNEEGVCVCLTPIDVSDILFRQLWKAKKSAILTSGTLAIDGSFGWAKQSMGIGKTESPDTLIVKAPFNYREKCLLYLPNDLPMVDEDDSQYIEMLSDRILQLISVTHGHTLVLFTAYKLQEQVYKRIEGKAAFPIYVGRKNPQHIVKQFKREKNAVLFAAGAIWQGVDFPRDMVSSLIIPRLPFPQPDAVSEAMLNRCETMEDFMEYSVIPSMQKQLRQGVGRAIRTEADSCVVAIMDRRGSREGKYYDATIRALPEMPLTETLEDVSNFIHKVKADDYFQ